MYKNPNNEPAHRRELALLAPDESPLKALAYALDPDLSETAIMQGLNSLGTSTLRKACRIAFADHPLGTRWTAFVKKDRDTSSAVKSLIRWTPVFLPEDDPRHDDDAPSPVFTDTGNDRRNRAQYNALRALYVYGCENDLTPQYVPVDPDTFPKNGDAPAPNAGTIPIQPVAPMQTPEQPVAGNKAQVIAQLLGELSSGADPEAIKKAAREAAEQATAKVTAVIDEIEVRSTTAQQKVNATLDNLSEMIDTKIDLRVPRQVTFHVPDREPITVDGQHETFDLYAQVQLVGTVALTGPAGSGKTTAVKVFADAVGQQEATIVSVGAQTSKTDIFGYMNAVGDYVESAVYRAITKGHVLLLDEFDACNPGVSKQMNAILDHDSRTVEFPHGKVDKHDDFRVAVAMNTTGRGADRLYLGGRPQDASSLNRMFWVHWGYDVALEDRLTKAQGIPESDANKWIGAIDALRKCAEDHALRVVIGTRAKINGARLIASGIKHEDALNLTIFNGLSEDESATLRSALK